MLLPVQTAIGHWCEMMFPLYSILRTEPGFARPAAQFVLLHLKRSHLMEWVSHFSSNTGLFRVPAVESEPPTLEEQIRCLTASSIIVRMGAPLVLKHLHSGTCSLRSIR